MQDKKINLLLQDTRCVYHTQDLMVLWGISNPNTLYTTIARYKKRGILHGIYKGLYATRSVKEIDPYFLGLKALQRYGYLSTESVLREEGVIMQEVKYITLVSDISRRFEIAGRKFLVRKMKSCFLNNKEGVFLDNGVRRATLERAVADILYFNPAYYFDGASAIKWKEVKKIQKNIGYEQRQR